MLDFCARGADGVTVRRVTLFVVVFRMAGGLPSRARVATGEELRSVFIVAVLQAPAGLPSLCERVPPDSLAWLGAAAALRRGSLWKGAAGSRAPRNRVRWALGGHNERRAGHLRAS